jgi:hypothetical protein
LFYEVDPVGIEIAANAEAYEEAMKKLTEANYETEIALVVKGLDKLDNVKDDIESFRTASEGIGSGYKV